MDGRETKLLEMIGNGVTIFEPTLRTSKELVQFQETAQVLLKLEKDGLRTAATRSSPRSPAKNTSSE